jgi:hypothetical protein
MIKVFIYRAFGKVLEEIDLRKSENDVSKCNNPTIPLINVAVA